MNSTEISYKFKQKVYPGKAYLLDTNSKDIVITGYGSFDTEALELKVQFDSEDVCSHDRILVIIETPDGYFAPLLLRDYYSIGLGGQSSTHDMSRSLHWPLDRGLNHVLDGFEEMRIAIDAVPEKQQLTHRKGERGTYDEILYEKSAKFFNIDKASFSRYSVEANSSYSWSSSSTGFRSEKITDLNGRIVFIIKDTFGSNFNFLSLGSALFAFKSYWLISHSSTDCDIVHFKLGSDVDFIFDPSRLYSPHYNSPNFRSIISIKTELHPLTLLKCIHFAINPDGKDGLSANSKIGLALSSLVRHAYDQRSSLLEHRAVSLIAGFQGLSEAIAQGEISRLNKVNKPETLAEIETVLRAVRSVEDDLSTEVREFYLKDPDTIYRSLSRPTFKRSAELALKRVDIDVSKHAQTISAVNKARKQIVHHEGYSIDNLRDLVTMNKNEIKRNSDGKISQIIFGINVGELDKLFDLTLDMMRRYIEALEAS